MFKISPFSLEDFANSIVGPPTKVRQVVVVLRNEKTNVRRQNKMLL